MHCDLVMLLRHDRRTVRYQSWVSLTISGHHSPIFYTSWLVQVFSYFIRWVVTVISRWSVYSWVTIFIVEHWEVHLACVQAQWQPKMNNKQGGNKGAGTIREFPTALIASGGKGINKVLALSRTCRVNPMKSNCCGLPNSSPCLAEDTCTCMAMTKTLKSGVVKAGSGLFGYTSPVSSSFFVMNVFFFQCPAPNNFGCLGLSVIKRDIPRGVFVQISGSPKHSNVGHRFLPRRFYTKLTQ